MSEVPGGLSASQAAASDVDMYCHVCPTVKATAYCLQCKIYLCPACAGHHKMLPLSASHKLLEGEQFPSFYPTGHAENLRQCPDHPEEEIKFYCPSHDVLCCCACNVLNKHNQCTNQYIPQISKEFNKSSEYTKLKKELQSSEDKIKDVFENIDICLKAVEDIDHRVIEQFTKYKAEVIAYLDQREKELLAELKSIRDQDTTALEELRATANAIQADIMKAQTKLRLHEDNSYDIFIASKRVQAMLTELKTSLNDIIPMYNYVKLKKDPVVEKLLANEAGLVQIKRATDMSTAVYERKEVVNIASENVYIRNILVLSPDCILLCNSSQAKVQLVDIREGRVLSELLMPYWIKRPLIRRLCITRNDQAALTVDDKKVQMINIRGQSITLATVLTLKYNPWGVSTCGESDLVVSYLTAPWLEVISPDGSVRHQFHQTGATSHFKNPNFLTTSVDGYIYVSDWNTNTITKLDSSLQLLQTFSSPLLSTPGGIISISPEQLLVCSAQNNRIVLINTRTGESSILLGPQDGIERPWSLSYCPEQQKLYLAPEETHKLMVYRLTKPFV